MMRSSSNQGGVVHAEAPLENGLPPKEGEDERSRNVRELAAEVVEDVVQRAAEAVQERSSPGRRFSSAKDRGCGLQRLPTIQIDTVASPPPSPPDWTPLDEVDESVDETEIQIDLDSKERQEPDEDFKEFLKSYVEDLLRQAMVLAEKKLQFAGLPESVPEPELHEAAEKVVEEVIAKAAVTVAERLENSAPGLNFPDLPRIQIDSAPSSPEPKEKSEDEEDSGPVRVKMEEKLVHLLSLHAT